MKQCELTSGNKNFGDAREKFKSSGELIIEIMNNINKTVFKIDCLLLGKIIKNGQVVSKRYLSKHIKFNNYHKKNSFINQQKCGFSIMELYN